MLDKLLLECRVSFCHVIPLDFGEAYEMLHYSRFSCVESIVVKPNTLKKEQC